MNIRKTALELLNKYEMGEQYVNLTLSSHLLDSATNEERRLITSLLYTAVEHKITYDYYISSLSGRDIKKLDTVTVNILRLGFCQLVDISSIPDFAAVNETVKLCRNPGEKAFVNGILRTASKNKENLPLPDVNKNYRRYLSVKYSFPLATVKLFDALFGREDTERLLTYYNTSKYTDLFVNTLKISRSELISYLKEKGITAKENSDSAYSLRVEEPINASALEAFSLGRLFVQDIASTIAVAALSPKPGDRLIDVCSAPGGKSLASAVMMENKGEIFSFDLHESKLSLIESGRDRLGLDIIKVNERDALTPDETLLSTADKLICDVPCSGLGVLSKKPDLRYKDISDTEELSALQLEILKASSEYLKSGGEMIYSTCTLNPEENERNVEKFLMDNKEFVLVDFAVGELHSEGGMLTLLPHKNMCDGFFIAKLKRIN